MYCLPFISLTEGKGSNTHASRMALRLYTIKLHRETLLSGVSTLSLSRYLSASSCLMAEATFLLAAVIQGGHAEVAQMLLKAGASPNELTPWHGSTPLLCLAAQVSVARCRVLSATHYLHGRQGVQHACKQNCTVVIHNQATL